VLLVLKSDMQTIRLEVPSHARAEKGATGALCGWRSVQAERIHTIGDAITSLEEEEGTRGCGSESIPSF
jgi:hypothetical protein